MARVIFNQPISLHKGVPWIAGCYHRLLEIVSDFEHPETKVLENADIGYYSLNTTSMVILKKSCRKDDRLFGVYFDSQSGNRYEISNKDNIYMYSITDSASTSRNDDAIIAICGIGATIKVIPNYGSSYYVVFTEEGWKYLDRINNQQ